MHSLIVLFNWIIEWNNGKIKLFLMVLRTSGINSESHTGNRCCRASYIGPFFRVHVVLSSAQIFCLSLFWEIICIVFKVIQTDSVLREGLWESSLSIHLCSFVDGIALQTLEGLIIFPTHSPLQVWRLTARLIDGFILRNLRFCL